MFINGMVVNTTFGDRSGGGEQWMAKLLSKDKYCCLVDMRIIEGG